MWTKILPTRKPEGQSLPLCTSIFANCCRHTKDGTPERDRTTATFVARRLPNEAMFEPTRLSTCKLSHLRADSTTAESNLLSLVTSR